MFRTKDTKEFVAPQETNYETKSVSEINLQDDRATIKIKKYFF